MNVAEDKDIMLLRSLLDRKAGHVHFMGICGVGMAGLAFHLHAAGLTVSGCDANPGGLADWLRRNGINVARGHTPEHLKGIDWIVRSAAIHPDLPEIKEALAAGLPVFSRGRVLAELLRRWTSVAVCGTHGKTTVTAMLIQILRQCGVAPAYCIGGECRALDGVAGLGSTNIMVAEADESDGTLADYTPDITVLTNIEFDHAEHYNNMQELLACFAAVLRCTGRRVIYCADDPVAADLCRDLTAATGVGFIADAGVRGDNLEYDGAGLRFRINAPNVPPTTINLPVAGRHNALNALTAWAAAMELGVPPAGAAQALAHFVPVRRRFEMIADFDDIRVFSDYAHHPTETAAAVNTLCSLTDGETRIGNRRQKTRRRRVIFQPHRFSRTRALADAFPSGFTGVDELLLTPVYAASETPVAGGSVWDLYAVFRRAADMPRVTVATLDRIWQYLRRTMAAGDDLLALGAGDVAMLADWAEAALSGKDGINFNPLPEWRAELTHLGLNGATKWDIWRDLAPMTTLRIGGAADIFVEPVNIPDAALIMRWAALHELPLTMLGGGSNILMDDLGVRGVVMRLNGPEFEGIEYIPPDGIMVGAGIATAALNGWCVEKGLAGLEFLCGIPGTLGGALRMNAGAWGESIGERVLRVRCLTAEGVEEWLPGDGLGYAYRACPGLEDKAVLGAVLRVDPDDRDRIRSRLADIALKRRDMCWPRSAGSVFRNPPGDYAGRLLEKAGLKGFKVGGSCFSTAHANVIMTTTGAMAADVRALIEIAQDRIKSGFGIELEREIVYCS